MKTLPLDLSKPVVGQASIKINRDIDAVFDYVGIRFFDNYPKWALEIIEFVPLDGNMMFVGAKARQIRKDQGQTLESIFEIIEFTPNIKFAFRGVSAPYKGMYQLENLNDQTLLIFIFELTELELFMRPFAKLIRAAIIEGAENTVENIKALLC